MLKIAVFDSGWGGDLVADYLEENIGVIEVIRVIDWRNADRYLQGNKREMCRLADEALKHQIGKVDVIVLAGFMMYYVAGHLRRRYPQQKFVQMEWPRLDFEKFEQRRIMVLTCNKVKRSWNYRCWKHNFKRTEIVEPKCDHWLAWIDEGVFSRQRLKKELRLYQDMHVEMVILGNTHLWDLNDQIEYVLGWQVSAIDMREVLLRRVCLALQLEGAHYIGRL